MKQDWNAVFAPRRAGYAARAREGRRAAPGGYSRPDGLQLGIAASCDVAHRRDDQDVRRQPGVRPLAVGELADERQVELEAGAGEAKEEERSPVDAALVAAGRLADQGAQAVPLHGLGELEGRRAVRRADQHPHPARESRRPGLDDASARVVVVLCQAEEARAGPTADAPQSRIERSHVSRYGTRSSGTLR